MPTAVEVEAFLAARNREFELDRFTQEVDEAIRMDRSLSHTCNDINLTGISFESDYTGTNIIAMASMDYDIEYSIQEKEITSIRPVTLIINGTETGARFN